MSTAVAAPPAAYNFAAHLFERNAARASKLAYADDHGALDYGELERQARALAAALLAAGAAAAVVMMNYSSKFLYFQF